MDNRQQKKLPVQEILCLLPSMDKILADPALRVFEGAIDRDSLKKICTDALTSWRSQILDGEILSFDRQQFFSALRQELKRRLNPSLRPVLNCTGVVVHTNLGRSCLAPEAVKAAAEVAAGYSTLEYNLEGGCRGQRNDHIEWLLCQMTGAEAAVVVNNNAGAVLLVLAALAAKKEAVVSRGELVEIGGSFRIPDIMSFAGTRLVEVGCTNRTHLKDYKSAITDETAMLMKVHPSNFRISGFVSMPEREELAELAHSRGLLFMEDLGSGILLNAETLGIEGEASVTECLKAGVDLVTFSGDKILGGPQIGAVVGKKALIDRIRKYPLLRALRCDKMTLAAMEATLRIYLSGDWKKIPTLAMMSAAPEELKARAEALKRKIDERCADFSVVTSVQSVDDAVGGGAYPERALPGWAVALRPEDESVNAGIIQERLRRASMPVVAGARNNELLIHLRTLPPCDEDVMISSLCEALAACR
ncbi:MAG: L-seryl-tRNA(Sec) selenium transferase [Pyramidobacter sp.]